MRVEKNNNTNTNTLKEFILMIKLYKRIISNSEKYGLNLDSLKRRIDKILAKETTVSLSSWINSVANQNANPDKKVTDEGRKN